MAEIDVHQRGRSLPPGGRGRRERRFGAIAELAAGQHGVVARSQLVEVGCSAGAIDGLVASRYLAAMHHGVYAVGHAQLRREGHWLAAVLACGPWALLSYSSAAALLEMLDATPARIDVTAPRGLRRERPGIRVHHARSLQEPDRQVRNGIPVTSVPRTLLDLADVVPPQRLEIAIERTEKAHLLDLTAIEELLARSAGRRGITRLRRALSLPSGAIETKSPLERRFLAFCERHGLPRPQINVVRAGFEVDAYFPEARLVVELDSVEWHHNRIAFERDRSRDIALQLAGERVVRATDRRMRHDPRRLAAELTTLIGAGGRDRRR